MPRVNDCLVYKYTSNDVPCLFYRKGEIPSELWAADLTTIADGHWIDGDRSTTGAIGKFYFLLPKEYMT